MQYAVPVFFGEMLCCAVLCCAVLCCAVLCCAVLCCATLRCTVPCQHRTTRTAMPHATKQTNKGQAERAGSDNRSGNSTYPVPIGSTHVAACHILGRVPVSSSSFNERVHQALEQTSSLSIQQLHRHTTLHRSSHRSVKEFNKPWTTQAQSALNSCTGIPHCTDVHIKQYMWAMAHCDGSCARQTSRCFTELQGRTAGQGRALCGA